MTNISLGQFIDESLSSTDTNNPKRLGNFSDDYTLTGVSNWQQVQVNLGATAFDAYLQLVNASTGEVIAENNNYILGSKNSQLKFTVVPGVNYAIRATSLNANETGDYTIITNSLGTASSLVVTVNGRAGTVDPLGRFVPIGTFADPETKLRSFNDIAFSNDNKILSIKQDSVGSQLYSLDPGSGSSSLIGNLPSDATMTSLEFSPDRTLYGASDSPGLYTINPQTGVASSITNFNTFFGPATTPTDLVFDPVNNRFLFAELGVLFSVSLTGESTLIGETGFGDLRGLSFEGSTLVGFTLDERIIINPTTGKGTFDKKITGLEYREDLTDIKFADINIDDYILGAGSIPSATLTPTPPTPTPPTPTPPTPTPPTPTPPTPTPPTPTPPTPTPPTPTPPTVVTPPPTPPTVVTPTPTPPTVVTPFQEKLPNTVTADFVDSDTDKILKNGIKNLIAINDTAPLAVQLGSDLSGFNTSIRELDKLDDFKYGFWQEGIKDDPEKKTRKVEIRQLSESPKPENTWVLIHGWNDTSDRFPDLETALKDAKPNDRVLLLDWSDASSNGGLPKDNGNSTYATARLGNYFAAKWASPVAEWAVKKLEQEYGIDGKAARENLKIVGHSLGSLVSSEMGRIYTLGTNRKGESVIPNATGINTIIALDPPSQLNIDVYSGYTASYDLDGRTAKVDRPEFFQDIARNSLAFVGAKSLGGNQRLAAGSLNSFQMDFGNIIDSGEEHFAVIKTFTELIKEKGEIGNRILNSQTFNARQNTLIYNSEDAKNGLAHEGVLSVKKPNEPIQLKVRNAKTSGENDFISYETPKNDYVIGEFSNDYILADAGNDAIYSTTGNDTLYGDQGNDTIYAGKDNDILFGGEGNDFLSGDRGDDTLIGGKNKDTLTGGFGSDTFVFSRGDTASSIGDADIITDFGNSFIGFGGVDKIGLAGELKANMIDLESFNNGGARTALKVKGTNEYLAVLNGTFSMADLKLQENFVIPTIS
ncbi:hypothetical protein QUA07_22010 [Microcoleus sp. T3_A4]|uniref:hypothetical protein n=1 Tax=Microcoleus sp. T3_A4 TaxID=2818968 RepID=UPI002FD39521